MGPGFMIQASSRALESSGRQQGAREETCPGNAAWSWSPTSGPLHTLLPFPDAHVGWLLGALQPCSGVPSLSEALRLRWRPQLPSPPWPLPPARTDPMLCRLFLLTCSYRAKVSSPGSVPVSGWPRGRRHTWSPGLSAVGRPSWGALRGKGKGDGEGVNGGEIGSDRCGQTERPREARTELQVWGDPEGPRQTEIPTERKRQNARC